MADLFNSIQKPFAEKEMTDKAAGYDYPKYREGYQLPLVSEVIQKFEQNKLIYPETDALFESAEEIRSKFWVPADCPPLHYSVIEDMIMNAIKNKESFISDRIAALTSGSKRRNKKDGDMDPKDQAKEEWETQFGTKLFGILNKVAVKQGSLFDENFYNDQKHDRKLFFYTNPEQEKISKKKKHGNQAAFKRGSSLLQTDSILSGDSSDMVDEDIFDDEGYQFEQDKLGFSRSLSFDVGRMPKNDFSSSKHCHGCNCFNPPIRFLNTACQTEMACHFQSF